MENNYEIFNPEALMTNMMNQIDIVKQMVQLYLSQGVIDFENLKVAIENQDLPEIKAKAHHIKPTLSYIGAIDLLNDFQELESWAKENKPMDIINDKFQDISISFQKLIEELKDYYATLD